MKRKFCQWLVDLLCGEDIAWDPENNENGWQNDDEAITMMLDDAWSMGEVSTEITIDRAFYLKPRTYHIDPTGDDGEWKATLI